MDEDRIAVIRGESYIEMLAPLVMQYAQRALDHARGELTVDQVLYGVASGKYQLWLVAKVDGLLGQAVTELVQYPNVLVLRVVLLSGKEMPSWQTLLDEELSAFARREGATRMEAVGRRGLSRTLAPLGFKESYTVMTKELT